MKTSCGCSLNLPPPGEIASFTTRLRRESRKITGPRAAILDVLRLHRHPLATREIHAELPPASCNLATVYRAMQLLEKLGMVKRFELGDGVARYELVEEGDNHHFHHLVCTQCAGVVKIRECFPAEIQERIAARNGFRAVTHRLEFFGVCPRCQK